MTTDWTDEDLIELYEERVAIRMESNGDTREQFLSEQFEKWVRRMAYFDLRRLIGSDCPVPEQITRQAAAFAESSEPLVWGDDQPSATQAADAIEIAAMRETERMLRKLRAGDYASSAWGEEIAQMTDEQLRDHLFAAIKERLARRHATHTDH